MSHATSFDTSCAADCLLVDRRAFLSHAVLAAAAAALAACGGGNDVTAPRSALAAVGDVQTMTLSGTPVAVVRTGASSFAALSLVCPHARTTLNVVSGGFHCPNHGAQFDSAGRWTGGQGTSNMQSFPATYDAAAGTLRIG